MTVDVVGLRFGEANTESTASFPRTSFATTWWDVKLRRTVKVNEDRRCIPAVNDEVSAPSTAEHDVRKLLIHIDMSAYLIRKF
jgi:hypothetical protein